MSKKTAIISDPGYKKHNPGAGHPECPERLDAIIKKLPEYVKDEQIERIKPRTATDKEIQLCHPESYMKTAKKDVDSGQASLSTGDTNICKDSYDVALLAAGGIFEAVDAVMEEKVKNAFCLPRPPGHHATADRGMGFCIFNNVALAARYAQKKHSIKRVLIADWDVHHGNGTQDIFYEDDSVFFFSTHSWPFYPGSGLANETGKGKGKGYTINCPFPSGTGGEEVIGAFKKKLVPAMKEFKPELVLISAGFDARKGDIIGNFRLTDDDFGTLTEICKEIADNYAKGRIVSTLEGGYTLSGLASAAGTHAKHLAGK